MVKKKTVKKNTSTRRSSFKKVFNLFSKKPYLYIFIPVILVLGIFGYNKYLDYRNVQDMKQLLTDIEELKHDVETETGEELSIEADCSSGGKFATFYSCSIRLKSLTWSENLTELIVNRPMSDFEKSECSMLSDKSVGFDPSEDHYRCSFYVRPSSKKSGIALFSNYLN